MKILYEIDKKDAYSNIALNKYFNANEFSSIDKAFATELVYGTIRWKLTLDTVIAAFSKLRLEKLSPWILNILRLGSFQILKMSKVPVSAACNESVRLAGRYGHRASAGFVNAVLRNIARSGIGGILPSKEEDPAGYLSVMYSYPQWLTEKYIELFGKKFTEDLLDAGNETPELTVRTNTLKTTPQELIEKLEAEGVRAVSGRYAAEAVNLVCRLLPVAELKAFQEGLFQVQEESSMLPGAVLDPKPGGIVLDACAAPGGKATHLAQLMGNRGTVIARDIHEHKLKLIAESSARLGISIIKSELCDSALPDAADEGKFDRVLLDAPCTGLGIVKRKPDIKWARETEDIGSITALQKNLIQTVSRAVKPGGVMVYSTCTVLPEENGGVVKDFLERNPEFEADDIAPYLPPGLASRAEGCMLQTWPNIDGIDGFFTARLKRKSRKGK